MALKELTTADVIVASRINEGVQKVFNRHTVNKTITCFARQSLHALAVVLEGHMASLEAAGLKRKEMDTAFEWMRKEVRKDL
jgi:hypothetical protein